MGYITFILSLQVSPLVAKEKQNELSKAQMEQARSCANENIRLKRLACFDSVFSTDLKVTQFENRDLTKPIAWQRAKEAESTRNNKIGFIVVQPDIRDAKEGVWMSLMAESNTPQGVNAPLLLLTCIDNISRVELIFNKPVAFNYAEVSLGVAGNNMNTKWQLGEQGLVLRAGRGLPSIALMRFLATGNLAHFRSNIPQINGLEFNTKGLREHIKLLRFACHW